MVDVNGSCHFFLADSQSGSVGLVWGLAATSALSLHLSNEPGELSQWLCRDDSTINTIWVIVIIIMYKFTIDSDIDTDSHAHCVIQKPSQMPESVDTATKTPTRLRSGIQTSRKTRSPSWRTAATPTSASRATRRCSAWLASSVETTVATPYASILYPICFTPSVHDTNDCTHTDTAHYWFTSLKAKTEVDVSVTGTGACRICWWEGRTHIGYELQECDVEGRGRHWGVSARIFTILVQTGATEKDKH